MTDDPLTIEEVRRLIRAARAEEPPDPGPPLIILEGKPEYEDDFEMDE